MCLIKAAVTICLVVMITLVPQVLAQNTLFGQPTVNRPDTIESRIRIEKIPASVMMYQDVSGDYSQHEKFFSEIMRDGRRYAAAAGLAAGNCVGIYFIDPDTVTNPAELKWQVGIYVAAREANSFRGDMPVQKPQAPYKLKRLPETLAAVLVTDVRNSPFDGSSMYRWMRENGYVQTAPTRMESITDSPTDDPHDIPVRIIIPVVERKSGLRLPPQ
jgi:hypothetical protein